jgi:ribonuclease HII
VATELFPEQSFSSLHFEQLARRRGHRVIAGIDEAGRGPLAGPVVSAAVVLPENFDVPGLTDSKKLTAAARDRFYPLIWQQALAVAVGVSRPAEIDRINILQATLRSMERAVGRLIIAPDYLLIDGITPLPIPIAQQTLKKGDCRSLSISAASVVAKVVRDRIMTAYDRIYPGYGFAAHKGYGSARHQEAIARLGPTACHRRSFSGVREYCDDL